MAVDITHVRDDDDGVYMCRATNSLGEAVTTASMKVKSKYGSYLWAHQRFHQLNASFYNMMKFLKHNYLLFPSK